MRLDEGGASAAVSGGAERGTSRRTMNESDLHLVTRVFEAITDRTEAQGDALAAALAARWSPSDRNDPLARDATGHCLVCS
jgi:hypothetical protein